MMRHDLERLIGLTPGSLEFERERSLILRSAIQSVPEKHRLKVMATQLELDALRETMTPEEFNLYLLKQIKENLENISDLFQFIQNKLKM